MATKAATPEVADVHWTGVLVTLGGESRWVPWDALRSASRQEPDPGLRRVYRDLLADATRLAAERKAVRVSIHNLGGHASDLGALTWAATLELLSGELLSGRVIAADWGLTGRRSYAERDAATAREVLARRGYTVL